MSRPAAVWLIALLGCDSSAEPDGPACLQWGWRASQLSASEAVDLLLVIDDSSGMAEEQAALTTALSALIERILAAPDVDGDGLVDRVGVTDLHVGVVVGDLGADGHAGCGPGSDGELERTGQGPGCEELYPSFLTYEEGDDPAFLAADARCVSNVGTDGCLFQQPLEVARRALTVHQDGANEGFLREGSVLAIVLVTNGDDCSVRPDGGDLFDPAADLGPLPTRCALAGADRVEPVERYAAELLARADRGPRLVVAALAGVPAQACGAGESLDELQCLLDHTTMQPALDASGERLVPSCSAPETGDAVPPRRLVSFVRAIVEGGGSGSAQSICTPELASAMAPIGRAVHAGLGGICLSRPPPTGPNDVMRCVVEETLTDAQDCPPARIDRGVRAGHRRCQICGAGDGESVFEDGLGRDVSACAPHSRAGDVWEIRTGPETGCPVTGRFVLAGAAAVQPGSNLSFQCHVESCPAP